MKFMLIIFFHCKGVIWRKSVQTVNSTWKHLKVSENESPTSVQQLPDHGFYHDNALSLTAFAVMDPDQTWHITQLSQPPYSPDVASFRLLPLLPTEKGHKKTAPQLGPGHSRGRNEGAEEPVSAFQEAISDWQSCRKRCVDTEGAYF
uniref:Histone-lysine N-methyltransferase SETMAR-like protein n=1 Tax=Rhipicephalus appendiculatus TaxID=34631 RepID=A0A131Z3E0_RHIAP